MKRTTGFNPMGDRYAFDFRMCTAAKGWAQLDTAQDASYYGQWLNPTTREYVSYVEGDMTHVQYETDAEFVAGVRETVEWERRNGYFKGIDGMCRPEIVDAFTRLGLAEFLH
jgi:hypothetical protein